MHVEVGLALHLKSHGYKLSSFFRSYTENWAKILGMLNSRPVKHEHSQHTGMYSHDNYAKPFTCGMFMG